MALENPGFESGGQGWDIPQGDGGMSTVTPQAAYSGAAGLRVTDGSQKQGSSARASQVRVKPGMVYRLSFFARTLQGQGVGVYLLFYDAKGKRVKNPDGTDTTCEVRKTRGENGWQGFCVEAKAPEAAAQLGFWIHSFSHSVVTADFDDFKLEEISPEEAAAQPMTAEKTAALLPESSNPEPEQAFVAMKVLQPGGKALRAPQEDWAGARTRVAQDAAWAQWLKDRRANVDDWMALHNDRVEWRGGWHHDFVSSKDGSFLVWTDEIPGEQVQVFRDKSGAPVEITPKLMAAWVFRFRMKHADMMVEAAQLWRLTGDTRYRDWAAAQLDFYADNYEKWPLHNEKGGPARLHLQPLDEAMTAIDFSQAARLLGGPGGVSAQREKKWADRLLKPMAALLGQSAQKIHNIATWQRCAAAVVALQTGDEGLLKASLDGPNGVRAQVAGGVTGEYIWCEQSLGYNRFLVSALNQLFAFAGLKGQGDLLAHEGAVAQNLLIAPMGLRFANDVLPNPSDATGVSRASFKGLDDFYRTLPTWGGLKQAEGKRNWDTLLDPPEAVESAAAQPRGPGALKMPDVVAADWTSTRFAVLKKGDWQVFFHYGQLGPSHAQAEGLNWEAFYKKTDISHDPGTVGYGSPMHKGFYKTGLCHNVPLINGEWPQDWNPGKLTVFDAQGGGATADMPLPRAHASATRTLRVEGDALVEQTQVVYSGPRREGARMGMVWQLQGVPQLGKAFAPVADFQKMIREALAPWQTDDKGNPLSDALAQALKPYAYWKNVRACTFENEAQFVCAYPGGLKLRVQIKSPGRFVLCVADAPDRPPARRATIYLEKIDGAKTADFTLRLSPEAP